MTRINFNDYQPQGNYKRRKAIQETAEHLAAMGGGEVEDYVEEARQMFANDRFAYNDDDLISQGFALPTIYKYTDAEGALLYESLRYQHNSIKSAKAFRQRRRAPSGSGIVWLADAGLVKVPYNWPVIVARPNEPVFWTEGEKDADRLIGLGMLATTAAGQGWSIHITKALAGRDVVVLVDNDDKGRQNAEKAVDNLRGWAARTRTVALPGLGTTEDVSDWLDAGHTVEELREIVASTKPSGLHAEPAPWIDPKTIPPRRWLYAPHYVRGFISLLISTGGVGKSSLIISEVLAMISSKPLLGVTPREQKLRVWYWNGEDPLEELRRRFAAAQLHFGLTPADIEDRLFLNSGHDMPLVVAAEEDRSHRIKLAEPLVQQLIEQIRRNKIDVMIIDPFVTCHRVNENDNAAIERVAKAWAHVAEAANCSVMLVHHSRKNGGGDALNVDDGRGASALLAAARTARALNTMTKPEAQTAGIEERERRRYFRSDIGKANLTRPAEAADWFNLVSVDLENAAWEHGGDSVGVVTAWSYPRVDLPQLTTYQISAVQAAIKAGGRWRADARSKREPWVGIPIAQTLRLDLSQNLEKQKVKKLIGDWLSVGWLKAVKDRDDHREEHDYVVVGETAGVESTTAQPETAGVEKTTAQPETPAEDDCL
jgi:hypothetical protein